MADSPDTTTTDPVAALCAAADRITELETQLRRVTYLNDVNARHAQRADVNAAQERARTAAKDAVIARHQARILHLEARLQELTRRLEAARPDDPAGILRQCAEQRRLLARNVPDRDIREILEFEATTLGSAADVVEGNYAALYSWLPSDQWLPEMLTAIGLDEEVDG
jgi:hypothetical protein